MKGEVAYLYAFDVANEIAVERVTTVLGKPVEQFVLRPKHAAPKDVSLHRPLVVNAMPPTSRLFDGDVRLQVHIYEVGVVNVAIRVRFERAAVGDLFPFRNPTLDDGKSLDNLAIATCAAVCHDLGAAMIRPASPVEPEAYTVFSLNDVGPDMTVSEWYDRQRMDIAGVLSGLAGEQMSEGQIQDTLRLRWSLEQGDLVIVDWDAALLVDVNGPGDDVLYVLEIANLQLEEFRRMDAILDRYLNRAYEDLERRGAMTLFGSKSSILRQLRWFRVDLTKLADEVTNITKFVGDWYLARVYLGARERFHLDRWRGSIEQRLGQLDQLYNIVREEIFERRMIWLEVIMVIFFAIDLLAILWLRK